MTWKLNIDLWIVAEHKREGGRETLGLSFSSLSGLTMKISSSCLYFNYTHRHTHTLHIQYCLLGIFQFLSISTNIIMSYDIWVFHPILNSLDTNEDTYRSV